MGSYFLKLMIQGSRPTSYVISSYISPREPEYMIHVFMIGVRVGGDSGVR